MEPHQTRDGGAQLVVEALRSKSFSKTKKRGEGRSGGGEKQKEKKSKKKRFKGSSTQQLFFSKIKLFRKLLAISKH